LCIVHVSSAPLLLSMYVLYVQKLFSLVSISVGSGVLALKTRLVCFFIWEANGFIYLLLIEIQCIYKEIIMFLKAVALWVSVLVLTTSLLKLHGAKQG